MPNILNTLKNIPKKILILTTVISTVALSISLAIFNLERTVEFATALFFDFKVKTEEIEFKDNKIYAKNIKLYGKDNDLMVSIPKANATYDSIFDIKVKKIYVENAVAYIKRDNSGQINFSKTFYKPDGKIENKEEVMKDYKPHIYRFADEIIADNIELNYEDLNYSKPIRKKLNTYATLKFNEKNAMEIYAIAKKDKFNSADVEYTFSDENEPYSMEIKSKNLNFEKEWGQYIWDNPKIHFLNGDLSSDIKISYLGYFGDVNLDEGLVVYDDFEENIKNIDIKFLFDKEDIRANASYNIFGNEEKVNLTFIDKKLNILVSLKNINSEKILKYKPLQNQKIDLSEINIKNISSKLTYSKNKGLELNINSNLNNSKFKNIIFKDLKLNYFSKSKKKYLKNSYLLVDIFDVEEKISLDMKNEKNNFYELFLKTYSKNNDNLIPNTETTINLTNKKNKVNFDVISNLVNFKGDFFKEKKSLKAHNKFFDLEFDTKNKFISFKHTKNKKNNLDLNFFYNLKNNDFDLSYDSNKFNLKKKYKDDDIYLEFSGKGFIKRKNNILSSKGNFSNLNIKYKGYLENFNANYFSTQENEKSISELHGEIGKIVYGKYNLSSIKVDLGLKDNVLKIFDIENSKIFLQGDVNLKNKNMDLSFSINNLNNQDLMLDKLSFNLESLKGSIFGNLKNPNSTMTFENLKINLEKYGELNAEGELNLKNKKIEFSNIKINNNKFTGFYNIENGEYTGRLNIFEENITKYLKIKKLKARLISQIDILGNFSEKNKFFNINFAGSIDKVSYNKKEFPRIYFKAKYSDATNFTNGILKINEISILNNSKKKFLFFTGYVDLNKKYLNISSEKKYRKIKLSNLLRYADIKLLKETNGNIFSDFYINGELKNPTYSLELKSYDTKVKDINLGKIEFLLDGNFDVINLKKLNVNYAENIFYANGEYNLENQKYSLNLKSNKMNFNVLNKFFKDKNIRDLAGEVEIDFKINNDNSAGFMKILNGNLNIPKYNYKISELDTNIILKNKKIEIEHLKSKMNDGNFKAKGYIELPQNLTIFNKEILKNLDYSIETSLDNFNHSFPKVSDISLHSNILLSNKKIEGGIYLNSGTIYDIPNNYKNIWKIISSFILKKIKSKDTLKEKYELPEYLQNLPYLNMAIVLNNPLKLDMINTTTFIDEIKGKVYASLNLKGENGKFYILGNGEVENSYAIINSNKFFIDRGLMSFNKRDVFLPEFVPNIFLESHANIDGEEMGFNISGNLKKLRFNIVSKNGNSNGDLNSLLSDIKNGNVQSDLNNSYYNLLKSLISNQITNTVFGSASQKIKRMLKLSKFNLKSDITTANINEIEHFSNEKNNTVNYFKVTTILEVEDNLYKDKLFLNANTKLFSTSSNLNDRYSKISENNNKEYDVNLDYRYKDYAIGVGVGSIPQKYRTNLGKTYNKKNYHIDFKFRKKLNSFRELFSF